MVQSTARDGNGCDQVAIHPLRRQPSRSPAEHQRLAPPGANRDSLRLEAEPENCIDCKRCTKDCPMGLDVNGMVQKGAMENSECVLCGTCVDVCPQGVIRYSFSAGK